MSIRTSTHIGRLEARRRPGDHHGDVIGGLERLPPPRLQIEPPAGAPPFHPGAASDPRVAQVDKPRPRGQPAAAARREDGVGGLELPPVDVDGETELAGLEQVPCRLVADPRGALLGPVP